MDDEDLDDETYWTLKDLGLVDTVPLMKAAEPTEESATEAMASGRSTRSGSDSAP